MTASLRGILRDVDVTQGDALSKHSLKSKLEGLVDGMKVNAGKFIEFCTGLAHKCRDAVTGLIKNTKNERGGDKIYETKSSDYSSDSDYKR
jgi:hypothetical protein